MSTFLKPVVVLLVSILLFAGVFLLVDVELLDFIQTQFYNPSIEKSYIGENAKDAEIAGNYIFELQERFAGTLKESAVRNSFLYNQSAEDIFERSRIFGILLESTSGLQIVQFIDTNGIRIHYSTSARDIISQSPTSTSYRNYTEDPLALPYEEVSVSANDRAKFTMDEQNDRIIFSFPFNDSMDVYHGTALFTLSVRALLEKLVAEGRISINETISVVKDPPGILFGAPESSKADVIKKVSSVWAGGAQDIVTLDAEDSGARFSLISLVTDRGLFFGRLVNNALFSISSPMRIIILLSIFLTLYLALYFLVNIKPHAITVVQNRIRHLREKLFDQLKEDRSTQEKIKWLLELEQRRDEIKAELKYKLKIRRNSSKAIDNIIDKSWDELIAIVRASSGHAALALKLADIQPIIATSIATEAATEVAEEILEEVEEVETVEAAEAATLVAEEIEEVEEAEAATEIATKVAEEIEDLEEISEIETLVVEGDDEIISLRSPTTKRPEVDKAPVVSRSAKGLFKRASEYEPEEISVASSSGLLKRASEYEIEEIPVSSSGLLQRASEYEIEEYCEEIPLSGEGLLAKAGKVAPARKGLFALASEIEARPEFVVIEIESEPEIDEEQELTFELEVVSPFDSMFASLE